MIDLSTIDSKSLDLITNPAAWLLNKEQYLQAIAEIVVAPKTSYQDLVKASFEALPKLDTYNIVYDSDLSSGDIAADSIAYHRIAGLIRSESYYSFSSKRFEADLLTAEANPNIAAHFLHITSGGGEAWYMDRVFETLQSLEKPVYAHVEKICASAAYYIVCTADKIYAETPNCVIGSIGVMCSFTNMRGLMERFGIKNVELYAENSDLKNKRVMDALYREKPEELIKKDLNPIRDQFADAVRSARKALTSCEDTDPVMRGEDYRATEALSVGLIDGIQSISQSLGEVAALIEAKNNTMKTRAQAIKYL